MSGPERQLPRGLYAIVDMPDPARHDPGAHVAALARGGAGWIQLRAKSIAPADRMAFALDMAAAAYAAQVPLVINDDVDIALAGIRGVAGLHLGQEDLAALKASGLRIEALRARLQERSIWLGISTHDLAQVESANAVGADYIGFGPVFSTRSKKDPDPVVGLDGVRLACQLSDVPVVAIGGLELAHVNGLVAAGVAGIALISGLRGNDLETVERLATTFARRFSAAAQR